MNFILESGSDFCDITRLVWRNLFGQSELKLNEYCRIETTECLHCTEPVTGPSTLR